MNYTCCFIFWTYKYIKNILERNFHVSPVLIAVELTNETNFSNTHGLDISILKCDATKNYCYNCDIF